MSHGADSEFLLYTDMGCAIRPPVSPGRCLAEATMTTSGWVVLVAGAELHVQLMRGASVPADAGTGGDLRWELATAYGAASTDLMRLTIAVANGPPLDRVGVIAEFGADAAGLARRLATASGAPSEPDREAAWDRLSGPVRHAKAFQRDSGLIAAVLAYRGRGRVVGPLQSDMLTRFGVSAWR